MAIDSLKARKEINDYCKSKLRTVTLISGGNEFIDGNIQVYAKRNGSLVPGTAPLDQWHPEIKHPTDKRKDEMSCDELAADSTPQLVFTNNAVANMMCIAFYKYSATDISEGEHYGEVYTDILDGVVATAIR
jgi:hypothetical protein